MKALFIGSVLVWVAYTVAVFTAADAVSDSSQSQQVAWLCLDGSKALSKEMCP